MTRKCGCGCGGTPNPGRGWLYGHRHKSPKPEYLVDAQTGCWVWQRAKDKLGYGHAQQLFAHRVIYERHCGPIPAGLQLDHLCRNRACVNPDHLEPVTCAENVRRGAKSKLTNAERLAIRLASGSQRAIAAQFGVSQGTVWRVQKGVTR